MPNIDLQRVRRKAQEERTDDLLDRVTVYREGLEPEAVDVIEGELRARGLLPQDVADHAALRAREPLLIRDGFPISCSFCTRPAVAEKWEWQWGMPRFPA